jgi:hypothetical protein
MACRTISGLAGFGGTVRPMMIEPFARRFRIMI